jgi:hypothetical protein
MQMLGSGFDYVSLATDGIRGGVLIAWRSSVWIVSSTSVRLECARDHYQLAPHEEALRHRMKLKSPGLASLQRTIARQESRLLWLSEGDVPMRFFHVHANARRRRKFIHTLQEDGPIYVEEDQKAYLAFSFFDNILGTPTNRSGMINLELLDLPWLDLSHLEEHFTETEVWEVIKSLPLNKAPSQMGLQRVSYRRCGKSSGRT